MGEQFWINEVAEKIKKKMLVVASRSKGKIPYGTVNGRFDDMTDTCINWWTNGFWGGEMWQMYAATKEPLYKELAEECEAKLDSNLMQYWFMDHDNGFKWLPTAVANYRLTGNQASRDRGLLAANNLAGRFNPVGRFIRAWNDGDGSNAGWAIIDCMMNLPLLFWAYKETNDPRFYHIATMHADTAERYFIREDGSANHIVEFNTMTGEFVQTFGGQGYAVGSSWTRGQAWALYGFTLSYLHTGEERYLHTAKRVADYFVSRIPESNLIPVDFCQPKEPAYEDSTAAAIASCGLLELAKLLQSGEEKEQDAVHAADKCSEAERGGAADVCKEADKCSVAENCKTADRYRNAALGMLKTLAEERCNWSEDCDNLLEKCTAAYHDEHHEFTIIYGDYYFIEAIWKLTGEELFIW